MDAATMINECTKNEAGIRTTQTRTWDTRTRVLASVDRAHQAFGYEATMPFEEGLRVTIDWFKANWNNIQKSASFPPGMSSSVRDA